MWLFRAIYRLFLLFLKPDERSKRKLLALVGKEIKANKYKNFYNVNKKEALPLMGAFFFDIYKCIISYRKTLLRCEKSNVLKEVIFNRNLDNTDLEVLYKISEDYIKEQSRILSINDLANIVKTNTAVAEKHFNELWHTKTNKMYININLFAWFITFDYVSLLQKLIEGEFDPQNITEKPRFKHAKCSVIAEHLKDFLAVTLVMKSNINWCELFKVLKEFDESIPDEENWLLLHASLFRVLKSEVFELIIRHSTDNPEWQIDILQKEQGFSKAYLNALITNCWNLLAEKQKEIKSDAITQLVQQVFTEDITDGAEFYNDAENEAFQSSGYQGYTHIKPFNYLLAFLYKYCENFRELANVFLIKGSWFSHEQAAELSQIVHNLNESFQQLSTFDRSLNSDSDRGLRLKTFFSKAAIGKRHSENLRRCFEDINHDAQEYIDNIIHAIMQLNKQLWMLEMERQNPQHQHTILRNWHELEPFLKDTMSISECIQKIKNLIDLIRYVNEEETVPDIVELLDHD